jgi:hypothetical protein
MPRHSITRQLRRQANAKGVKYCKKLGSHSPAAWSNRRRETKRRTGTNLEK